MIPEYGTLAAWAPLMIATSIICLAMLLCAYLAHGTARGLLRLDERYEQRRTASRKTKARTVAVDLGERTERLTQIDRYRKAEGAFLFTAYLAVALAALAVSLLLLPPWFGVAVFVALLVLSVLVWRRLVSPGLPSALRALDPTTPGQDDIDDPRAADV